MTNAPPIGSNLFLFSRKTAFAAIRRTASYRMYRWHVHVFRSANAQMEIIPTRYAHTLHDSYTRVYVHAPRVLSCYDDHAKRVVKCHRFSPDDDERETISAFLRNDKKGTRSRNDDTIYARCRVHTITLSLT